MSKLNTLFREIYITLAKYFPVLNLQCTRAQYSMKCKNIQQLWTSFINVLSVLFETFRNFMNIVTKTWLSWLYW